MVSLIMVLTAAPKGVYVSGPREAPSNLGSALSHGAIASDISGANVAAEQLATAIVASLFREEP
jgi:hypothetical protein